MQVPTRRWRRPPTPNTNSPTETPTSRPRDRRERTRGPARYGGDGGHRQGKQSPHLARRTAAARPAHENEPRPNERTLNDYNHPVASTGDPSDARGNRTACRGTDGASFRLRRCVIVGPIRLSRRACEVPSICADGVPRESSGRRRTSRSGPRCASGTCEPADDQKAYNAVIGTQRTRHRRTLECSARGDVLRPRPRGLPEIPGRQVGTCQPQVARRAGCTALERAGADALSRGGRRRGRN